MQCYLPKLLERIEDPSFVITHRATLDEGPVLYNTFRAKKDGCIKVVMKPYSDDGILIGTSGWHYDSWRGTFFPKGLPLRSQLQFYASQLPTAELN